MTDYDLKKFCRQMLSAVEGSVVPLWFAPKNGLCNNASRYDYEHATTIYLTLDRLFEGKALPFNDSNLQEYIREKQSGKTYQNKKRMAFLKKYAERD